MPKAVIYLDTSVIRGYPDPTDPFIQRMTREFWVQLPRFDTCISTLVELEISDAPPQGQEEMSSLYGSFKSLPMTDEARALAERYLKAGVFRQKSGNDALHVAIATVAQADFLVSWNFHDMVKVRTRRQVTHVNLEQGYKVLEIVALSEL